MELRNTHLRYLLTIYELSQTMLDVGAVEVARTMGVSKPSVTRMLGILMEKGLLVRERYGKIYLTDQGVMLAKKYDACVENMKARLPALELDLSEEQLSQTAQLLAVSLSGELLT